MALASDATKIMDLKGATLMPSFIDAHGHFMNAPQVVTWANVSGVPVGPVTDIPSIVEVLKAHVKRFDIKPGEWVVGYGYDGTTLAEGRELSAMTLIRISRPSGDAHACVEPRLRHELEGL